MDEAFSLNVTVVGSFVYFCKYQGGFMQVPEKLSPFY